jgi:anaerobic magnesium-protoporphyrin IX monomethyl ester cyclase
MKILFINPSLRPEAPHRYLPVGLAYVMTAAHEAGFKFDLLDVDIGRYSNEYVEQFLAKNRYDVIALGSIVTHYRWTKWCIQTAKEYNPACKIIVGNSVGGSIPEVIFRHTPADIIVKGEADVTFVEVLRALNEGRSLGECVMPMASVAHRNGNLPSAMKGVGVEGIIFRSDDGTIINNGPRKAVKDINTLSNPNWDLFDVQEYLKVGTNLAHETVRYPKENAIVFPVNTARGCVFQCTFCHYVFWNDPYRHRSAANVIGEIKHLQQKYSCNYIEFWDELSFHKLQPAEKFVDELIAADLGIHWSAAVRTDLFGRDDIPYEQRRRVAEKFKMSGALALGFSLESGNDKILEAMNKKVKAKYFDNQVELLRDVGLISNTSLVLGYPQETLETIAETMEMCRRNRVYPSVGFLLPLPETGMWDYALEHGHITEIDSYLSTMTERQDIVVNMTKLPSEALMSATREWLERLNEEFGRLLPQENLIRTGGYATHNKHQEVHRHRNTDDSFNYAKVAGVM